MCNFTVHVGSHSNTPTQFIVFDDNDFHVIASDKFIYTFLKETSLFYYFNSFIVKNKVLL